MQHLLRLRAERLAAGERAIGWKMAFGAPDALERLGLAGPVVGFLTDRSLVANGAQLSVAGWTKPALEPEIAVHMARDLAAGADANTAAAAIGGLSAAIEIADVDQSADDVEAVVSTNIYHRAVVLGEPGRSGARLDDVAVEVYREGALAATTSEPTAMTGEPLDLVRHVANLLDAFGERLRAGEVIITGSVIPLVWLERPELVEYDAGPVGRLSLRIEL